MSESFREVEEFQGRLGHCGGRARGPGGDIYR